MGIDVELVEGVGPVVARAGCERAPTSRGCGSRTGGFGAGARGGAPGPRGARAGTRAASGSAAARSPSPGYLVEGKPSRDFLRVKELMYRDPAVWHALMEKLADGFRRVRARAGATRAPT